MIRGTRQQGIGTLFVSHKLDEVLEISDRMIVMRNGEKVADEPAGALDRTHLIQLMTGRELDLDISSGREGLAAAPVLLEAKGLASKNHFEDISFTLRAGEILGITGLLGSGRTNLALSLFGMLPADGGALYVDGKEVTVKSVQDALACWHRLRARRPAERGALPAPAHPAQYDRARHRSTRAPARRS